jgi:hypothetical protein
MTGRACGRGHDARVGGEDAVDVGVDLAHVGLERGGERHRGRVGAAPAQGGDLLGVLADALEAGDDDDVTLGQRLGDPPGVTSMILALPCSASVMTPAWLPVNERACSRGRRSPSPTRAIEIRSPAVISMSSSRGGGFGADLVGQVEQLVGAVAHGRDDDDDVVAGLPWSRRSASRPA